MRLAFEYPVPVQLLSLLGVVDEFAEDAKLESEPSVVSDPAMLSAVMLLLDLLAELGSAADLVALLLANVGMLDPTWPRLDFDFGMIVFFVMEDFCAGRPVLLLMTDTGIL